MVRNWGYFSQVRTISREIYEYFNDTLEEALGFSITNVMDIFELLINQTEKSNTERYKTLKNLYKSNNKKELLHKYHELIGLSPEKADLFLKKIDTKSMPFKSVFLLLLSHYDLLLSKNYEFSPADVADKIDIKTSETKKILKEFSYQLGGLEHYETDYLFLSNPVWLKPIIEIDDESYFCVFPQVFFSFVIPSLERIIEKIDKAALSDRRSAYLEDKIAQIINKRFPKSLTISGVKWKCDNIEYETDLIAFIDSYAVIVEAKSGKITEPALRGAPNRLKKHVEDILIGPNIQSKRLKKRMEELINHPEITDDLRDNLPVDLNNIYKIIRVSVALEDFGFIQANIARFKETGWLPDDFESCPTMNLADFETLFDFLEHPVQILHYLERRQEIENEFRYIGDEIDLMGLYIRTLFNFDIIDSEIMLTGMSAPLDAYYNSKDAGVNIPKPKPLISPLFSEILRQLEKRKFHRWTEIGVILNRFSPDDQRKLTKLINKLKVSVQNHWMEKDHKNIAVVIPSKASEYSLCYLVYNDHNKDKKSKFVDNAARLGFKDDYVNQCLVIAKNIDHNDSAYDFIGIFA